MSTKSNWFSFSVKSTVSLLTFCLCDLFMDVTEVLRSKNQVQSEVHNVKGQDTGAEPVQVNEDNLSSA